MHKERKPYEPPAVTGKEEFETRAIGCAKIPGISDVQYCAPVWGAPTGSKSGCFMNPPTVSRSS